MSWEEMEFSTEPSFWTAKDSGAIYVELVTRIFLVYFGDD